MKREPIRTCLACHKRFPKNQLLKFVFQNGTVKLDSRGSGQGRSAYCCDNRTCMEIFVGQKRKMSRAFRVQDGQISFEMKDWE